MTDQARNYDDVKQYRLEPDREQELVARTKQWVTERADGQPAYQTYLEHWGDWPNPWEAGNG